MTTETSTAITLFPILGLIALVLTVIVGYLTIKSGYYAQFLVTIAILAGVAAGIRGWTMLEDYGHDNDTAGAILVGIGIVSVLASGVATGMFKKHNTVNNSINTDCRAQGDSNDDQH